MSDCLFCKIIAGAIPSARVYEDEHTFAFLDINPVSPGHTLVLPKKHFANLYETPDEVLKNTIPVVKKIASAAKKAMRADGINVHINNDPAAGQAIFHLHFHIIPRFENDDIEMWKGKPYEEGTAEGIADDIRSAL